MSEINPERLAERMMNFSLSRTWSREARGRVLQRAMKVDTAQSSKEILACIARIAIDEADGRPT